MTSPGVEWVAGNVRLTVYDKAYELQGWIGLPLTVDGDVRCNQVGSLQFTLDTPQSGADLDETEMYAALTAEGARVVCDYRPLTGPLLTGMVTDWKWSRASGQTDFTVTDDLVVLLYLLGWADPAHALAAQATDYYVASGVAETVLKTLVSLMLVRYPDVHLTVAPDLGRGGNIDVQVRFDKLGDKLLPLMDGAGLRVVVYQDGLGRILDVVEPGSYPLVLSDDSGIVEDGTVSMTGPTVTDVITGDDGIGAARVFTSQADDDVFDRFGERIVTFVDAASSGGDGPSTEAKQDIALAAGRPKYTVQVTLAETEDFAFGDNLPLGTQVQIQLGPHPIYTDRIRSVALHLDVQDGLVVTPQVGDLTDDDGAAIADALTRIDRLERR